MLSQNISWGKMQIALLETTPCYIDEKDKRRHVEFIRKPKRFFKRNLFECPLCLGMLTLGSEYNYRLYEIGR